VEEVGGGKRGKRAKRGGEKGGEEQSLTFLLQESAKQTRKIWLKEKKKVTKKCCSQRPEKDKGWSWDFAPLPGVFLFGGDKRKKRRAVTAGTRKKSETVRRGSA